VSRRDVRVITAIWIVALVAAGEIWGENPTADEEIYLAAFIVIVGSLMTGVYFVVREARMKKKTGGLSLLRSGSDETTTPAAVRRSRAWLGVVDVFVVLVLWQVGYQIARLLFSETTSEFVGVLLPLAFLLVGHVRRGRGRTQIAASTQPERS
jgi:hypothetical protein